MAKLEDIYAKYQDPRWLNSVREFRHKALRDSNRRRPLTGSYYWIPRPDSKNRYSLACFSDQEFGDTSHYRVWNRFVLPMISQIWEIELPTLRRRLRDNYTALPRGRVLRDEGGYRIIHGENYSTRGWENKIKKQFNIRNAECKFETDPYEVILIDDLNQIQKITNRQFNLVGVDPYETIKYTTETIEEARFEVLDNDLGKRFRVLTNPHPSAVLQLLDQTNKVLGGWEYEHGVLVWIRDHADHNTVAKQMGFRPRESLAFYITPSDTAEDEDGKRITTDIEVESSEWSGNDNIDQLMSVPMMDGLRDLIEKRKEELGAEDDFSMDELMSGLSASDY